MALSIVTPIAAVASVAALLAVIKPDALVPDVAPKVLSSVIVPGNTSELDPSAPGFILAPADIAV
jgi:hypothetical protein